jgi:hypothetical protein
MPRTTRPNGLPRRALLALGVEERCEGKPSRTVLETSPGGDTPAEFDSCRVCTGSHVFPSDPARVPEEFFRSYFSRTGDAARGKSRRHPDDIGALWAELDGQGTYPLDDLVPVMRVADAFAIGG